LGKHSGRHAFRVRLKHLSVELSETELDKAFERFKKVADKKKQVFDEDLLTIVEDEVKTVQKVWSLVGLTAVSGTNRKPQVKLTLKSKGKKFESKSSGDGPIDACYKAIDAVTKTKGELLDYSIQSVTRGKDALGEVTIKVKIKDKSVIAHGASTDIVEASAKAYLNAINKVLSQES
jgi:2-isopropylmalate synthase